MQDFTPVRELLTQCLHRGQRVTFTLKGTSLNPLLRSGDSLLLEAVDPGRLGAGQLVVFEGSDGFIVHRILRKRGVAGTTWFQTAGQRARIPDAWIPAKKILGRVVDIRQGSSTNWREAPGGWTGELWAWRTQILCLLHRTRERLNRFAWR
jgi:hypothetical protein